MTLATLRLATSAAALVIAAPLAATDVSMGFDVDNFDTPLVIDNQYWPLVAGSEYLYKAETDDGCEWSHVRVGPNGAGESPTKIITIGLDMLTVRTVADFEYEDEDCDGPDADELVEKTFDWYGQDNFGNIWYFGENTLNCDGADNCQQGEGRWEAGQDVQNSGTIAEPGIIMLGSPRSGDRYRQEFYEDFAEDWAMVMNLNRRPTLQYEDAVPPGTWDNCLVTKEWNGLEPGSVEQKTYCPDANGLVLVQEHGGKLVRFELVEPGAGGAEADAFDFRVPPQN